MEIVEPLTQKPIRKGREIAQEVGSFRFVSIWLIIARRKRGSRRWSERRTTMTCSAARFRFVAHAADDMRNLELRELSLLKY